MDKLQLVSLIGGARPHLGATRPRVGIANLGLEAPNWQYLKYGYLCICLSRHRALSSKCRRGDASPPGEDAMPPSEDAFFARNEKD